MVLSQRYLFCTARYNTKCDSNMVDELWIPFDFPCDDLIRVLSDVPRTRKLESRASNLHSLHQMKTQAHYFASAWAIAAWRWTLKVVVVKRHIVTKRHACIPNVSQDHWITCGCHTCQYYHHSRMWAMECDNFSRRWKVRDAGLIIKLSKWVEFLYLYACSRLYS